MPPPWCFLGLQLLHLSFFEGTFRPGGSSVFLFAVLMLVNITLAFPEGKPTLDDNEKVVGKHEDDEDKIFFWWYG